MYVGEYIYPLPITFLPIDQAATSMVSKLVNEQRADDSEGLYTLVCMFTITSFLLCITTIVLIAYKSSLLDRSRN